MNLVNTGVLTLLYPLHIVQCDETADTTVASGGVNGAIRRAVCAVLRQWCCTVTQGRP